MNVIKSTIHQFDPKLQVVIVDVTEGVQPDTLIYNLMDKDRTVVSVEPDFEKYGSPTYEVPRYYAERQLANNGGRTFRLVSPKTLTIKVPNGRGGTEYKTIRAHVMRGDGKWHEMTDDEINGIETEDTAVIPDIPKKKGVTKKAASKAKVQEVESDMDFEEPTLDDVLGED